MYLRILLQFMRKWEIMGFIGRKYLKNGSWKSRTAILLLLSARPWKISEGLRPDKHYKLYKLLYIFGRNLYISVA